VVGHFLSPFHNAGCLFRPERSLVKLSQSVKQAIERGGGPHPGYADRVTDVAHEDIDPVRDPGPDPPARSGVQVIARAAKVMRALERTPEGLTLGALANEVELPKSTVHRLVVALQAEDFLAYPPDGPVRLGRALVRLGAATRSTLRVEARPYLLRLHGQVDETVDLAVLDGATVTFVDHIVGSHWLRAASPVGAAFPLHCTANGKALLATMSDEHVAALLPRRLDRFTEQTITTHVALRAELGQIRRDGVAFDREEHADGIAGLGSAIYDPYGVAGAISIVIPAQRFPEDVTPMVEKLKAACAACSRHLLGTT